MLSLQAGAGPAVKMVALIPARAGSKRVPGKNTRLLNGVPLVCYTIAAALQSDVFRRVTVFTDDDAVWNVDEPGCWSLYRRKPVSDEQADIEWVREALTSAPRPMSFAILRPTSPFRTAETIRRAYAQFTLPDQTCDSLRAVEPVKQSPYKMWTQAAPCMPIKPLLEGKHADGTPYHSSPTQSLPLVYVQNSSLEMSWTSNVETHGTISGRKIAPFFTEQFEGFSIDTEADWREAEHIARAYPDALPPVDVVRLSSAPAGERPPDPRRAVSR
jgi:CMP-N,N'-diacetyllegionaminic acid synthase